MSRPRGFTLIELMIAVAVVAILTAIAYPSYNQHVRKGKRGEAKATMMDLAQQLERRYTTDRSYLTATTVCGQTVASPRTGTVAYQIATVCPAGGASYTITATPQGSQAGDTCGTLTIAHTGAKTPTTAGCW